MPEIDAALLCEELFYEAGTRPKWMQKVASSFLQQYKMIVPPTFFSILFKDTPIMLRCIGTHELFIGYLGYIKKSQAILSGECEANTRHERVKMRRRLIKVLNMEPEKQDECQIAMQAGTYVEERTQEEIDYDSAEDAKEQQRIKMLSEKLGPLLHTFEIQMLLTLLKTQEVLPLVMFLESYIFQIASAFQCLSATNGLDQFSEVLANMRKFATLDIVYLTQPRCVLDAWDKTTKMLELANKMRRSYLQMFIADPTMEIFKKRNLELYALDKAQPVPENEVNIEELKQSILDYKNNS